MVSGYSDHSLGIYVPLAAAALGAKVIEKHFTLDNDMPGPDHQLSLNPDDFTQMVEGVRAVERSMGNPQKTPVGAEMELRHQVDVELRPYVLLLRGGTHYPG